MIIKNVNFFVYTKVGIPYHYACYVTAQCLIEGLYIMSFQIKSIYSIKTLSVSQPIFCSHLHCPQSFMKTARDEAGGTSGTVCDRMFSH